MGDKWEVGMLSIAEIKNLKINKEIIIEAVNSAKERLSDSLDTRKQLEQKCFILLSGYLTITLAICSATCYLYKVDNINYLFFVLSVISIIFIVALGFIFFALKGSSYGTLGRHPETWLQPHVLDGTEKTYCVMLGYILHGYVERIETSINSNEIKCNMLNIAIILGCCSPVVFILGMIVIIFPFSQ